MLCLNGILWILGCSHCLLTSEFSFREVNSTSQRLHLIKEILVIPPTGLSTGEVHIRRALEAMHNNTAENTFILEKHAASLPGHCCRAVRTCTSQAAAAPALKGCSHFWATVSHECTDKPRYPQPFPLLRGCVEVPSSAKDKALDFVSAWQDLNFPDSQDLEILPINGCQNFTPEYAKISVTYSFLSC